MQVLNPYIFFFQTVKLTGMRQYLHMKLSHFISVASYTFFLYPGEQFGGLNILKVEEI